MSSLSYPRSDTPHDKKHAQMSYDVPCSGDPPCIRSQQTASWPILGGSLAGCLVGGHGAFMHLVEESCGT